MESLLSLREISGLSQFSVARKNGVPRVRLSLAETEQLQLTSEEQARIRTLLLRVIEARALQLQAVLAQYRTEEEAAQ
jgi:hypothetical protein